MFIKRWGAETAQYGQEIMFKLPNEHVFVGNVCMLHMLLWLCCETVLNEFELRGKVGD